MAFQIDFDNQANPDGAASTTVTGPENRVIFYAEDITDRPIVDSISLRSNFFTLDGFATSGTTLHAIKLFNGGTGVEIKRSSFEAPEIVGYFAGNFDKATKEYPTVLENCEFEVTGTPSRKEAIYMGGAGYDQYMTLINCQANDDQCTDGLNDAFIRWANGDNLGLTLFNNLDLRHDGKSIVLGTVDGELTLSGSNNVGRNHPFNFVTYGLGTIAGSATTNTSPGSEGVFMIYDADNKLVKNIAENDAWKSGVGPAVNPLIPFTDIEGKSRYGLTAINPGVYEVDTGVFFPPVESPPPPVDTPPEEAQVEVVENLDPASTLAESRSFRYNTRESDIRAEIFKQTKDYHNISNVYKETLRSMLASFADIVYINSENEQIDVPCIHGNAERAIAKIVQDDSIILPITSVSQTVTDNDATRDRYESVLVHEKVWNEEKQRAFRVLSLAPRAVNIKYQINIFGKYLADVDQILEQIRLKFNPEMVVPTPFSTMTRATIDSEENAGQVDAADKQDRLIKKTISVTVRTYIPNPKFLFTSTGKIERYNSEII
jgi:hypothetical protein